MEKCPDLARCKINIFEEHYTRFCIGDYKDCATWKIKGLVTKTPKEWTSVNENKQKEE